MEQGPRLHLAVVAIEKGAFWSSFTTVANFTHCLSVCLSVSHSLSLYIYI